MPLIITPTYNESYLTPEMSASQQGIAKIANPLVTGMTMWRIGTTWFSGINPSQDTLDLANMVLLGGHIHKITDAEYFEILNAGFDIQTVASF